MKLRYGCNPHQQMASIEQPDSLPFTILNGEASYINILDLLTGWQIVRDIALTTGSNIVATSVKHCTPIGVAIDGEVDKFSLILTGSNEPELSQASKAYLRARSTDWLASYGDAIVIYGNIDITLAKILSGLVSDCIMAISFDDDALDLLKKKKKGSFLITKMDPDYYPGKTESRTVCGFTLHQDRNDFMLNKDILNKYSVDSELFTDLAIASQTMKFTVSNNIVTVSGGRILSVAAGQQARVYSTELAGVKMHRCLFFGLDCVVDILPENISNKVALIGEAENLFRNIILGEEYEDCPVEDELKSAIRADFQQVISDKRVVLGSDGFIPFPDNITFASRYGINIILEPTGAIRAEEVYEAARQNGIEMIRIPIRFFYH